MKRRKRRNQRMKLPHAGGERHTEIQTVKIFSRFFSPETTDPIIPVTLQLLLLVSLA